MLIVDQVVTVIPLGRSMVESVKVELTQFMTSLPAGASVNGLLRDVGVIPVGMAFGRCLPKMLMVVNVSCIPLFTTLCFN